MNKHPLLVTLLALSACTTTPPVPPVVTQDHVIDNPTPVVQSIDPELSIDCAPAYELPTEGPLPLEASFQRLASVEDALRECRARMGLIRNIKP